MFNVGPYMHTFLPYLDPFIFLKSDITLTSLCRAVNNGRSTDNVRLKIGFVLSNP